MRLPLLPSVLAVFGLASSTLFAQQGEAPRPNIVVIYADDLGIGDIGPYGADDIPTPNIDALADSGLRFTDGHCGASTCTPSRYTLLTGHYAFRGDHIGIATGDAAMIIPENRPTIGDVLGSAGYQTAAVGKWHLGMGSGNPDWNSEIAPGVNDRGFDYSFMMAATQDRVPTVYVENQHVVGLNEGDPLFTHYGRNPDPEVFTEPTGAEHPELLSLKSSHGHNQTIVNGIGRIGYQAGGHSAWWQDESLSDTLNRHAQLWIAQAAEVGDPFFLYYAAPEPHVPRTPNPRFQGMTPHGTRGDAIVQFDWQVGQLVEALERAGVRDNTLIVLVSDNGPVLDDGYRDGAVELLGDHKPSGPYRGGKYSLFEGGTRTPFITNWPGEIEPGVSAALVSQVDFLPSFAELAGAEMPSSIHFDGINLLSTFLGRSESGREELIEQDNGGHRLALRQDNWKYIEPGKKQDVGALYNLDEDPGEQDNLAGDQLDRVEAMETRLDEIRAEEG